MFSRLFTENATCSPSCGYTPLQAVRRSILLVKPLISIPLRLCVLPVNIFYMPIIYLARLLGLACKLFVLPDGTQL